MKCEFGIEKVCTGRAEHNHHKLLRRFKGADEFTADICSACHRYVHDHPTESYEKGWMIRGSGRPLAKWGAM